MTPYHPWAFRGNQNGFQDGHQKRKKRYYAGKPPVYYLFGKKNGALKLCFGFGAIFHVVYSQY